MKIKQNDHCQNSPKNDFIQQETIQVFTTQQSHVTNLSLIDYLNPQELIIDIAFSHGKFGVSKGVFIKENCSYNFSCHFELVSAGKLIIKESFLFIHPDNN